MKPIKRSIAVLVRSGPDRILVVRRPPDDEDLPDAWGLPAGSLRPGEEWEEAVRRAGKEKLGVRLHTEGLLREGELERGAYRLRMRLYGATIEEGEPAVPQAVEGVTQYAAWEWAPPTRLAPAAAGGSLCSRLALAWWSGVA
jgi:ADP-ribose pyrophosphatase YjhB (NUDIX family)